MATSVGAGVAAGIGETKGAVVDALPGVGAGDVAGDRAWTEPGPGVVDELGESIGASVCVFRVVGAGEVVVAGFGADLGATVGTGEGESFGVVVGNRLAWVVWSALVQGLM